MKIPEGSRTLPPTIELVAVVYLFQVSTCFAHLPINNAQPQRKAPEVTVTHVNFHGWDAIVLRNHLAEATVVPAIGRIMQFKFLPAKGQNEAQPEIFWNNPALGPQQAPDAEGWINYGGDKAWPAPQSNWPKTNGKTWPPPKAFDALPYTEIVEGDQVELVSQLDPTYGIRVRRTIRLDAQEPSLTIKTTFEKVQGAPALVGIWTVSQLTMPERAFILLPLHSRFSHGYVNMLPAQPSGLKTDHRLLSLVPEQEQDTMIGSDGATLLWVGANSDLLMENKTAVLAGAQVQWPDRLHSKIYTNAALKYVELELFAPLTQLRPGGNAFMQSRYTLFHRTERDTVDEAKKIFALALE